MGPSTHRIRNGPTVLPDHLRHYPYIMTRSQPHNADSDAGVEWGTPEWIWSPLADALGGFGLDPATAPGHAQIAKLRFTGNSFDGLEQPWLDPFAECCDVWLNPPYGRAENPAWAQKVRTELEREDGLDTLTALVPASTSTNWWQSTYGQADILTFIGVRVEFLGNGDDGASFASCIASFGEFPDEYRTALKELSPPDKDITNTVVTQ